jgi:hypothetical protein
MMTVRVHLQQHNYADSPSTQQEVITVAQMPIIDLSSGTPQTTGSIDWSKPDELPPGTYRCERGWNDTSGAEWGCTERATTDVADEHLCTAHALIETLAQIREAMRAESRALDAQGEELGKYLGNIDQELGTVSDALWDINYTLMPMYRKIWMRVRGWYWERAHRRMWRRNHQSKAEFEQEEITRNAVRAWLKYPTPSNAEQAAQRLAMYADAGAAQAFIDSRDNYRETYEMDDAQAFIEGHDVPGMRQ